MALTSTVVLDQISILEDGTIQVRTVKRVFDDDGSKIGERFHRVMLAPGDDVSTQPARLQRIVQAVWTQSVIDDYKAKVTAALQRPA